MEGRIDFRALVMGVLSHLATALAVGMVAILALCSSILSQFFQRMMAVASAGQTLTPAQAQQFSQEMATQMQAVMNTTPALAISVAVGLLALLAGGYVTANYARGAERKNALALGAAYAFHNALGVAVALAAPPARVETPWWPQVVLVLLAIPVTLGGAALRVAGERESGAPPGNS